MKNEETLKAVNPKKEKLGQTLTMVAAINGVS